MIFLLLFALLAALAVTVTITALRSDGYSSAGEHPRSHDYEAASVPHR